MHNFPLKENIFILLDNLEKRKKKLFIGSYTISRLDAIILNQQRRAASLFIDLVMSSLFCMTIKTRYQMPEPHVLP